MRNLMIMIFSAVATPVVASELDVGSIVEEHVLPRYQILVDETFNLATQASNDCTPNNLALVDAYHDAFDAWVQVSHLRFGPSEHNDRAYSLAFWPDPRGSTPKALTALLQNQEPVVSNPNDFASVSVAAKGFYAMEVLLFDPAFIDDDNPVYHCALVQAVAAEIAQNAAAILEAWQNGYGDLMSLANNDTYRTPLEAAGVMRKLLDHPWVSRRASIQWMATDGTSTNFPCRNACRRVDAKINMG